MRYDSLYNDMLAERERMTIFWNMTKSGDCRAYALAYWQAVVRRGDLTVDGPRTDNNDIATRTYDAQVTQVIDPRGVTTDYTYNGFNELIETDSPDAGVTTYAYDKAGNRIRQTDARGITVNYQYDALNRLMFIDYPGTDQDITYTYDGGANGCANCIGRLTRIDDETGTTEYAYGIRGNLTHKLSVIEGETGEQYLPVGYGFDAADNLTSLSYPSGAFVQYLRDPAGRITALTLTKADGTTVNLVTGIQYAPFGPVNALTYGNGITETRSFDREGRIGGIQGTVLDLGYTWSATGNITAITDNLDATRSQSFDYDALYRLTSASGIYGEFDYEYDAVSNRLTQSETPVGGSLQSTTYTYASASNRLATVADKSGVITYQYDANGNTTNNGEHTFGYDARNRFIEADGLYTYQHNALGQRVVKPRFQTAAPGDASGDGVINESDLRVLHDIMKGREPDSPGGDCNQDGDTDNKDVSCIANQIGDTKNHGKDNGKKQDEAATGARSDPLMAEGLALASTTEGPGEIVGQVLFVYDEAGHLLGEYDELGEPFTQYVWLGNRPVAMLTPNGVSTDIYYIHSDHLNTPKVVTDENQTVVWTADYTPFGEAEPTITTLDMPLRFPGQIFDSETNLSYNYFRTYDPRIGRYGQNDPIGLSGGLNRYTYVKANPISRFDQYGLFDAVNPADYPNLDPGDGGVFCDGRGGFRVWVPNDWDECIRDCVVQHENMHLNHIYTKNQQSICSGKTADHRIVASTQEERLWTERIAYQTEKRCLQKKLAAIECGDACESRIRNRIDRIDERLAEESF